MDADDVASGTGSERAAASELQLSDDGSLAAEQASMSQAEARRKELGLELGLERPGDFTMQLQKVCDASPAPVQPRMLPVH